MVVMNRFYSGSFGILAAVLIMGGCFATPVLAEAEPTPAPVSRFQAEIGRETGQPAEAPAVDPVFRWDFSRPGTMTYSFSQEARTRSFMGPPDAAPTAGPEQKLIASSALVVRSQGDGTADWILRGLTMVTEDPDANGNAQVSGQSLPAVVLQGLNEDGAWETRASAQDMMVKLLFPLPGRAMKVGESVDLSIRMPFVVNGSILLVRGRQHLTLSRYVTLGGRPCARFDAQIDVGEIRVPPELPEPLICRLSGSGAFWYDVEKRTFVQGEIAVVLRMAFTTWNLTASPQGSEMPVSQERVSSDMVTDNLIRVRLQD